MSEQAAIGVLVWRGIGSERPVRERTLRARLAGLGLRTRFTVNELAEALARQRGKPIVLRSASFPAGVLTGGLLMTDSVDFIAYPETTPLHRDHIIGHELGHLLAGHTPTDVRGEDALRLLAPDIDPAVIRRMLSRTNYSDREEQEAEAIAGWLSTRFHPTDVRPGIIVPDGVDPRLRTLLDALSPEDE